MRNILACCVIVFAMCLVGPFGLSAYGQDKDEASTHHRGEVQDWSRRHAVYALVGPPSSILGVRGDPRAIESWDAKLRRERHRHEHGDRGGDGNRGEDGDRDERGEGHHSGQSTLHRDWSIPLGGGTTAPSMYPAKFNLDPNALVTVANCNSDFVVFPVNAAGSGTQPNIVAFKNIYSGTAPGPVGLCNRGAPVNDDGVSATTLWSYNIEGIGAGSNVSTSPTMSLDGTKVVFVETEAGNAAHFHVLAWSSAAGNGQDPANAQNVLLPHTINSFVGVSPVAGSGTATDLTIGSTAADTNTLSSPFIDYPNDVAYVGNDNGKLFRVLNVFCANPGCAGAAPSLDASVGWGVTGKTVCTGKLTAPVQDGASKNIFVGCSDGKLYGFHPDGTVVTNSPLIVGDGTTTGGIVDPPVVDAVNGFVYVTSGSSPAAGPAVLVQTKTTDLSALTAKVDTLGPRNLFNMHAPDFNDPYFSNIIDSTTWIVYIMGLDSATGTHIALYGATFDASHNMVAGPPANQSSFAVTSAAESSPVTEFLNGLNDQLFESGLVNLPGNVLLFPINTFPGNTFPAVNAQEGSGASGIIVDNSSAQNQASSIYFGVQGTNRAAKLTQAALQ